MKIDAGAINWNDKNLQSNRDARFLASQRKTSLEESMSQSLQRLAQSKDGFVFTPATADGAPVLLDGLKVKNFAELCLFGELEQTPERLQKFLISNTNLAEDVALAAGQQIQALAGSFLRQFHQETAMIMVRTASPTEQPFAPRWHQDGTYMGGKEETKLVWSMAGRGTLVAAPEPEQRKQVETLLEQQRSAGSNSERQAITARLDALVEQVGPQAAPDSRQATLFRVGDHSQSCLHSEPAFDQERIFVAVVPTSQQNLATLRERFEFEPILSLGERIADGRNLSLPAHRVQLELAFDFWGESLRPAFDNLQESQDPAWRSYAEEKLATIRSLSNSSPSINMS